MAVYRQVAAVTLQANVISDYSVSVVFIIAVDLFRCLPVVSRHKSYAENHTQSLYYLMSRTTKRYKLLLELDKLMEAINRKQE